MKGANEESKGKITRKEVREIAKATDNETKQEYLPFVVEGIKKMIDAGCRYPFIKKATSPTAKFQMTGHLRIWDALQGYWERNKNQYTHRAKSDYRALYIGTIHQLQEETVLTGRDNSVEVNELELYLREKNHRHKAIRDIASLRAEIKTCIMERSNQELTDDGFEDEMEELIDQYAKIVGTKKSEKTLNDLILEEEKLAGGRSRSQSWRDRRKKELGLQIHES
jgi:hypothetical protein